MKYLLITLFVALLSCIATAKQVRVAVIDSGYNGDRKHLCPDGHYDFIAGTPTVGRDQQGHGTNVVSAIIEYGEKANYCILVFKVFGKAGKKGYGGRPDVPVEHNGDIPKAIYMALNNGVKVINMSLDGEAPFETERAALIEARRQTALVFVAAGNSGLDLDIRCASYPACYKIPGVVVVGGETMWGKREGNKGTIVDEYEDWCYNDMCGTSMSTAIATGKFVAGYK